MEIDDRRSEIEDSLRRHKVTLIEAPTGLGKSTKIPLILRELFPEKNIAISQPRRIAAVSLAHYLAKLSNVKIGEEIGYSVRFDSKTSHKTRITFCTDGILLKNGFDNYDIVIVDEAHCRSIASDIILALIREALKITNLKLVIMSATMKTEIFLEYFSPFAPKLLKFSTTSHPVQLYYAPYDYSPEQMTEQVATQITYILANYSPGDILVFVSGLFEIERLDEKLTTSYPLFKLHSSYSSDHYNQLFSSYNGFRIILATNIAESSITIPNVKYVIDTMLVKRFELKNGTQLLVEKPITKFEASQRLGRAGRLGPGICWRMMTEESFKSLDEAPEAEILSANYSDILLTLAARNIRPFDLVFLTPFDAENVQKEAEKLYFLGLIGLDFNLTSLGFKVAEIPLETELALALIKAKELNCFDEMAKICAMISSWPLRSSSVLAQNAENDLVVLLRLFNSMKMGPDKKFEANSALNANNFNYTFLIYKQLKKNFSEKKENFSENNNLILAFFSGFFLNLAQKISVENFIFLKTSQKLFLNKKFTSLNNSFNFISFAFLAKKRKEMIINVPISPENIKNVANHVYFLEKISDKIFVKFKNEKIKILLKSEKIEKKPEKITNILSAKKRRK